MLLSFVRSGDWIVDVGAHIGTFSVPIAKAVGPSGRVFAFEAMPEHFELLQRNRQNNNVSDIIVPINAVVTGGLLDLKVQHSPNNTGATRFDTTAGDALVGVPKVSMDSWWEVSKQQGTPIRLIKVDVEGMEYDVLHSAEGLISEERPIILFEVATSDRRSSTELNEFFGDHGYHLFVNLQSRGARTFSIGRLGKLSALRRSGAHLFDILAIHPQSSRYPRGSVSLTRTRATLLYRHVASTAIRKVRARRR